MSVKVALLGASLAVALQVVTSIGVSPVRAASAWHKTDPVATVCGNGSHPVKTWRGYYLRDDNNKIMALVELRYSRYCNTVWMRIKNLTGQAGHYSPTNPVLLEVHVFIYTYNCANENCLLTDGNTNSAGTVSTTNDTFWTKQVDLPTGKLLGGSRMPPTVRPIAYANAVGGTRFSLDMGREPVFTWHNNTFENPPDLRVGTLRTLSCDNTTSATKCESWGTPGGSWATLIADISVTFALPGITSEVADMKNIIEKWSYASPNSPLVTVCEPYCNEDIYIYGQSWQTASGCGAAIPDMDNGATPATITHAYMRMNTSCTYDHSCGPEGSGCPGGSGNDNRPTSSHEFGHTLGHMHCDMDAGVMCHWTAGNDADNRDSLLFWTPQLRDVWGLEAMYP